MCRNGLEDWQTLLLLLNDKYYISPVESMSKEKSTSGRLDDGRFDYKTSDDELDTSTIQTSTRNYTRRKYFRLSPKYRWKIKVSERKYDSQPDEILCPTVKKTGESAKVESVGPSFSPSSITPQADEDPIIITVNSRTFEIDANARSTLNPKRMLNDTVVEFYSNYLFDEMKKLDHRYHLFNTFFYKSLLTALSDSKNASNHESGRDVLTERFRKTARRWDKQVDIFGHDFLVVPICHHEHWTLVIVCLTGITKFVNGENPSKPQLILFDSLRYNGNIISVTVPIRKFLSARWIEERPADAPKDFMKRSVMSEVCARIPRQRNPYDCGVHMLNALEKFLSSPMIYRQMISEDQDLSKRFIVDANQKRRQISSVIEKKRSL